MVDQERPIQAFRLDETRPIEWAPDQAWTPSQGDFWFHLNRNSEPSKAWLIEHSGLAEHVCKSLLASSTRPRLQVNEDGLLLILRGVNLNEQAEPSDMISLRIWIDEHRLISIERERFRSVAEITEGLSHHDGPRSTGSLLVLILSKMGDKIGPIVDEISERLDLLEDQILSPDFVDDRNELMLLRQRAIMLYRHIKPQTDVLIDLSGREHDLFDRTHLRSFHEAVNRNRRFVEELEASKSRMQVLQDELANQLSAQMNRRMYAVSLIATILLPMSILTGLLGINVGGIPLAQSPLGFTIVCVVLVAMGFIGVWIARKIDWL